MNILLIPDKFKGSLTAKQVIKALKAGISNSVSHVKFYEIIASDGGDGFLDAIQHTQQVQQIHMASVDPLGRPMDSYYLMNDKTAYIELANCSGLAILPPEERNALKTSTYGTGLQIKHALANGANAIYIGLGGSATNDGGMGIAKALGYQFLDNDGYELDPCGENLVKIRQIDSPDNFFSNIEIYAVNDVKNPLTGKLGAAMVYGAQKGADANAIELLDAGLKNLAAIVKDQLGKDIAAMPGAGAAGGSAYGLKAFLGAEFIPGTQFILQLNDILQEFQNNMIDLIITGEGKIDDQTIHGKLIDGIMEMGKRYDIPVLAVCGKNDLSKKATDQLRPLDIVEISDPSKSLAYNMEHASALIENAIYQYFKQKN